MHAYHPIEGDLWVTPANVSVGRPLDASIGGARKSC
ncbi:hypothetical protein EES46_15260 [Streptomyces sp. ADI98-10]|nr:hypothetical protein EES46_15260 [Streptomyces sp. ADI98-10]